jgi:hypothetical protein
VVAANLAALAALASWTSRTLGRAVGADRGGSRQVSLFAQIAAAEAALVMTPKALMARRIRIVPAEPEPETNGSALSDEARAPVAALYPGR